MEVTRSVLVSSPPAHAWDGFVDGINNWWPREHCHCTEAELDRIFIDLEQGVWGERRRSGKVESWGFARTTKPGQSLALGWQMDPATRPWRVEVDPARASLITVAFRPEGAGTRITLRHFGFERHGAGAQVMMDAIIGLDRWTDWLQDYARSL